MTHPNQPDLRAQVRNLITHAEAGQASLQALLNMGLISDPDLQRLAALLQRLTAGHASPVSAHRIEGGKDAVDPRPGEGCTLEGRRADLHFSPPGSSKISGHT